MNQQQLQEGIKLQQDKEAFIRALTGLQSNLNDLINMTNNCTADTWNLIKEFNSDMNSYLQSLLTKLETEYCERLKKI